MTGKVLRSAVAMLGVAAAFIWGGLFLANPRVSLELLVLLAPIVVPVWLITMLTRSGSDRSQSARDKQGDLPPTTALRDAVLDRDGGICANCGGPDAARIAARRPARTGEPDPLSRYVSLCADCATVTPLALSSS